MIVADADRQPYKYANLGYRFMAIETGQIVQNIALGAAEVGLAICPLGSLRSVISDELKLESCLPFLAIAVGKASDSTRIIDLQVADEFEEVFVGEEKPVKRSWLLDSTFADTFDRSYVQYLAQTRDDQIASGTSTSWPVAKLKAIAEAYERQRAASVRWDVRSAAGNLHERWLDPRVLAPLTDEQYAQLPYLQKFDECLEIEWIAGTDHAGGRVLVPIDLVFYPIEGIDRRLVVDTSSSGFAAHTDFREAVERGVLELVERDSLMRSWYEKMSPRRVDFAALPAHLQNRVRYWRERGREVLVLDLSQRGAIVIEVIITADEYPCFVSGASATLDRFETATIKALHEAESRLISRLNTTNERSMNPIEVRCVMDHELLYAQSREYHGHVQFLLDGASSDEIPVASSSFTGLQRELEIVTVNVSEPGSPLHVVKALSPQLVPISFGYGADHHTHHSLRGITSSSLAIPHYFA